MAELPAVAKRQFPTRVISAKSETRIATKARPKRTSVSKAVTRWKLLLLTVMMMIMITLQSVKAWSLHSNVRRSHSALLFFQQSQNVPIRISPSWTNVIMSAQTRLSSSSTSTTAETTNSQSEREGKPSAILSFTSPPMKVYIEDTDAYGIMYNGNYLRSYDRALHMIMSEQQTPDNSTAILQAHEGWSIVSVELQKFLSSPLLGSDYVIQAQLQNHSRVMSADRPTAGDCQGLDWEIWNLQMTSPDGSTVYNTVQNLLIAKLQQQQQSNATDKVATADLPPAPTFSIPTTRSSTSENKPTLHRNDVFTVYRDELDAHWTGHLPLRNVLNWWERARSNWFGGPQALRRLQDEDNLIAVVTHVESSGLEVELAAPVAMIQGGTPVLVETTLDIKRKGMICDCFQILKHEETGQVLARGLVKVMLLNATTRRPTSKLPSWLKDQMGL